MTLNDLNIHKNRPTVGIFSLSSCKGCQKQILNLNLGLIDLLSQVNIVFWPMIMSSKVPKSFDVAVIEGAVRTDEDKDRLLDISKKADKIVALGACACGLSKANDGGFDPIENFIDVDYFVRCCPIDPANFIDVLQCAIFGRNTFISTATLCSECKSNEVDCHYRRNHLCAGLISRCGCDAICTSLGKPCLGCSGVSPDAVMETAYSNARKIHPNFIDDYFDDFLNTCSISRFLNKEISDLSSKEASFVGSRSDADFTVRSCLDVIEEAEENQNVVLSAKDKSLRNTMRLAERAQNHLTTLFFDELRQIKGYESLDAFIQNEKDFVNDALIYRSSLTRVLSSFGGRAVCPITPKVGGFSSDVDDDEIFDVKENLVDCISFAKSLIDIFASVWERSSFVDEVILNRVMDKWDDLTDVARFGAAKARLRPPVVVLKKTCIAMAVEMVDDTQKIVDSL